MKKLLILLFTIALLGAACGTREKAPGAAQIGSGTAVPGFSLKDLSGNTTTLEQFNGRKAVILVFWTTWCPHCRDEVPELIKLTTALQGSNAVVLAVSSGESEKAVRSFAEKKGINYTVLMDPDGKTARAFGILGVPTVIIINSRGEKVYSEHSLPRKAEEHIRNLLQSEKNEG